MFFLSLILAATPTCTTSTDGGTLIQCGGARVMVTLVAGTPREALAGVVDGMSRLYSAVEKKEADLSLGKQRLAAIDLTLFVSAANKTPMGNARVTALAEPGHAGFSRVLVCTREPGVPLADCQRALETGSTVSNPTLPEFAQETTKTSWTGAPLTVPAGCQQAEPGSIQCKTASMLWGDRPADGPLNSRVALAGLALRQMPEGSKEAERPCLIGGKASSCSLLRGSAQGATFSIIIGVGDFKGRWTSFQCIALMDLKDVVPAPCDQLVTFPTAK